ncbi:Helix-turn-helix domain-containing protein [Propionispira arboris]|uniref:Helix-turn-helix domain-containing protein n=1 Tax=Propionispira arboris TaxID=84035 RepID=A0A1H6U9U5_9FIRM|nr:sigma-70 family RNA polymerase sigma factor [Propionispira arboris]SEI86397.1 Helix-turn-helix domain-containing protein [Propionispira arboris]
MKTELLVQKAQTGDPQAVLNLVDQFHPLLHKAAWQAHLASIREDALSQAYISFLEAVKDYNLSRNIPFAGYAKAKIYGDIRTLFKQNRRNWQRELSTEYETAGQPILDQLVSPTGNTNSIIDKIDMQALLTQLPLKQKQVLWQTIIHDKTQKETALLMHLSQQAIASLQKKALNTLRQWLSSIEHG